MIIIQHRIKQRLYAVGGFDGAENLDSMELFDSTTGAWSPCPPMTCPRRGLAAASYEGVWRGGQGKGGGDSVCVFVWRQGPAKDMNLGCGMYDVGLRVYGLGMTHERARTHTHTHKLTYTGRTYVVGGFTHSHKPHI